MAQNEDVEDLLIRLLGDATSQVEAYQAAEKAGMAATHAADAAQASSKKLAEAQRDVGQKMVVAGGLMLAGFGLAVNASRDLADFCHS